ncbi:sporulation peptidase YabG [Asaccharospora irregularis]|uniref:Spore coat assemly protein n=1 Tax=Asaccharospora irregularis DSM 2635 TaxID=1121321 RepID=A0A1M5LEU2_9FIRM|nr:sporulation peptidase YabG [Asaccharospora irregularis]SHG63518.1 spore coat assemly protein [Asaccharospora irregularis DSM 2635]
MKIGDIVARKSYNKDIVFKIEAFTVDDNNKKVAILKGVAFRIIADAYLDDLELVSMPNIRSILIDEDVENLLYKSVRKSKERQKKNNRNTVMKSQVNNSDIYGIPGKVLQIDGDKEYLKICLDVYTQLGIPAVGVAIPEQNQYKEVRNLLNKHKPDILVITGHDSMTGKNGGVNNINNYRNSMNFIKAVKEARKWEPNVDNLVIFAGACQSNYEQIIKAGANYASSPARIMIHALDPVFVVEKVACSRIDTVVPIDEVIEQTVTGVKGIGGSETRGKFRWAMPKIGLY